MEEHDRAELLSLMDEGHEKLRLVTRGLSDRQARQRPAAGAWSILECVEHLVLAERGLLFLATRGSRPATGESPATPYSDETIKRRQLDRRDARSAPEPALPTGRYESLDEALEGFARARSKSRDYVGACGEDLRGRVTDHPVAGTITAHQCLLLLALHPQRHCMQIEEIRSAVGFPGD